MLDPVAISIITNTFTGQAERARAIGVWSGAYRLFMALGWRVPLVVELFAVAAADLARC